MDASRFDRLARTLATPGTRRTRRGLLRLLAALPLGVTLASFLNDDPDALAIDDDHGSSHRHHRRVARHRHRPGKDKDHHENKREGCTAESRARTCRGRCGGVKNNCGKRIDCGACSLCQTCNGSGRCVADPAQQHQCDSCPDSDQWCHDGACASIEATVTVLDCESLCSINDVSPSTRDVCGRTVTCPICSECIGETGCHAHLLLDGPLGGSGWYCAEAELLGASCSTNDACVGKIGPYCANTGGGGEACARVCP